MRNLLLGALGGAAGAGIVWFIANRAIDQQLRTGAAALEPQVRQAVDSTVPPAVRQELEMTLRRYNITPETGRQISNILTAADSIGLIGLRQLRRAY